MLQDCISNLAIFNIEREVFNLLRNGDVLDIIFNREKVFIKSIFHILLLNVYRNKIIYLFLFVFYFKN